MPVSFQTVDDAVGVGFRRLPALVGLERRQLVLQRAVEPRRLRCVAVRRRVRAAAPGRCRSTAGPGWHAGDGLEAVLLRAAVVGTHRRLQLLQRRDVLRPTAGRMNWTRFFEAQRFAFVRVVTGQALADRVPALRIGPRLAAFDVAVDLARDRGLLLVGEAARGSSMAAR